MSGSEKSGGDWGQASESLFQSARADHDATLRDRMRVAEALARKLEAADPTSTWDASGISRVPTRGGGLISVSSGLKVALAVVLTVGAAALMLQGGRSPEHAEHKQLAAPRNELRDARVEVQAVSSVSEASSARPLTERAESPQAAGLESRPVRRHAVRSARAPEQGQGHSRDTVRPRSAATLRPNAPEVTAKPDLGQSSHADANADSTASVPSRLAAADSPADAHESPAPAAPAANTATDGETAALDSRAEIVWFERIHAALQRGQSSMALSLCNEHERRWPHGVFEVEREGVRALSACVLHNGNAVARARAFLQAYPRAPMAPRVVAACGEQ